MDEAPEFEIFLSLEFYSPEMRTLRTYQVQPAKKKRTAHTIAARFSIQTFY
jgi:hypothetical protein